MAEHTFHCAVDPPARLPKNFHQIRLHGPQRNIKFDHLPIRKRLLSDLPERMLDLIDIGAYVLAADRLIGRGDLDGDDMGDTWCRTFKMRIAVRDLEFWSQPEITDTLSALLAFLSGDTFNFEFSHLTEPAPVDAYFTGLETGGALVAAPVILFSGGLDSLSGMIEELRQRPGQVVSVTHRSSTLLTKHQAQLIEAIGGLHPHRILNIPVVMRFTNGLTDREKT